MKRRDKQNETANSLGTLKIYKYCTYINIYICTSCSMALKKSDSSKVNQLLIEIFT